MTEAVEDIAVEANIQKGAFNLATELIRGAFIAMDKNDPETEEHTHALNYLCNLEKLPEGEWVGWDRDMLDHCMSRWQKGEKINLNNGRHSDGVPITREALLRACQCYCGAEAAEMLDITPVSLWRALRKHGIPNPFKEKHR